MRMKDMILIKRALSFIGLNASFGSTAARRVQCWNDRAQDECAMSKWLCCGRAGQGQRCGSAC